MARHESVCWHDGIAEISGHMCAANDIFNSKVLHDLNRIGGKATRELREKKNVERKKKTIKHLAANIPEAEEIFYPGLESSFCSLPVGLQTFRVACCSLLGAAGRELFK